MKRKQLMICNYGLLYAAPLSIGSGIALEMAHGEALCGIPNSILTWAHLLVSAVFTALVIWHLHLNWKGFKTWGKRFRQHHCGAFKVMVVMMIVTIVTGIVATVLWTVDGHGGIGGLHGKLGYVSAVYMALHLLRHRRWYRG